MMLMKNKSVFNFSGKKGMGASQVFVFIMAAITFAVIMLFGFKAINNFLNDARQVEFIQFKLDLETAVNDIRTDFGARSLEKFRAPANFHQICFIDLDYGTSGNLATDKEDKVRELCALDHIACTIWEGLDEYTEGETNVFLSPPSEIRMGVKRILIENGYLCERINKGVFSVVLEGEGDRTKISKVPLS
jgi:hypothetical protein